MNWPEVKLLLALVLGALTLPFLAYLTAKFWAFGFQSGRNHWEEMQRRRESRSGKTPK